MQGAHCFVDTLAHLQQQQDLVDGRVSPLHEHHLLLHPLHLTTVGDAGPHPQTLHGHIAFQSQEVLREALRAAVPVVQLDESLVEAGPQRPEHAGEHGSFQGQV